MIQIKTEKKEKLENSNEKNLLTINNGGITILNETEETDEMNNYNAKIVWHYDNQH